MDLEGTITLMDLLEDIEKIEGLERVRIGSIEPAFFKPEVIQKIKNMKKLCPQFHLSLQSGCDATLKRMNRRYTAKEYEDIVNILRANIKDVSITTDVIVGFPGETEEEFNETFKFLEKIKLTKTHIFKYSPRKGTKAAVMQGQLDGNIKEARSKALISLNNINEKAFIQKHIGKEMDVLLEQKVKGKDGVIEGYTRNYIKVEVENSTVEMVGKIINCKIEKVGTDHGMGKIII